MEVNSISAAFNQISHEINNLWNGKAVTFLSKNESSDFKKPGVNLFLVIAAAVLVVGLATLASYSRPKSSDGEKSVNPKSNAKTVTQQKIADTVLTKQELQQKASDFSKKLQDSLESLQKADNDFGSETYNHQVTTHIQRISSALKLYSEGKPLNHNLFNKLSIAKVFNFAIDENRGDTLSSIIKTSKETLKDISSTAKQNPKVLALNDALAEMTSVMEDSLKLIKQILAK